MSFIVGFLYGIAASILTFIQLQGQFKWEWFKNNPMIVACMGIPISMLYLGSVKHLVAYFDGQLWPSRLLGFATGAIIFTIMSYTWFGEPLTGKTLTCLFLAFCIMMIQLFWK
jgi:multidrug transporter EmrE-like cation transporter